MMPRLASLVLSFVVALAGDVSAQTPTAEKIPRTFRILSFVGSYEDLLYQPSSKAKPQPITISRSLSQPRLAPTGPTLEIFRLVPPPPDAPPGTPPTRHVVLTASLDLSATECIVVARPLVPENKQTDFQAHTIALRDNFRAGTCLISNLSGFPSSATSLKKAVHTVDAGGVEIVPFGRGHNPIKVAVHVQQGDKWLLAGDDAWRLNESYRGYILILPYMDDPDYPPPLDRPPALVRINFEISPEIIRQKNAASR